MAIFDVFRKKTFSDAVFGGDLSAARRHIKKGVSKREQDHLLGAAVHNGLPMVKLLVENGASVNYKDRTRSGRSVLHFAASGGYPDVVQYLLEYGANVNATNDDGDTPLDEVYIDSLAGLMAEVGASPTPADIRKSQAREVLARIIKSHGGRGGHFIDSQAVGSMKTNIGTYVRATVREFRGQDADYIADRVEEKLQVTFGPDFTADKVEKAKAEIRKMILQECRHELER